MFTTQSNLLSKSGLLAEQLDNLLKGKGVLEGLGNAFESVEVNQGVNALWGIAQAALETGWGTSAIATQKNNLFGITAYDSNPYGDASSFSSPTDCVQYWGNFILKEYLTPEGAYYVSPTPAGVARHWASDPNYASKVVGIMNDLLTQASANTGPAPLPAPTVNNPAGAVYVVQPGDSLSLIAQERGFTLSQLESTNPQAGHPAGNYADVWPGDRIYFPVSKRAVYTVQEGDSLSAIAQDHNLSLAQLEALNPQSGHPQGNFGVIWPGDQLFLN